MNKKIGILVAAIVAAVIFGVSQFFPLPANSETDGTIGKVNKYRESNISAEDIRLRNELLKDPEALKATVKTLEFYEQYLTAFSSEVAECQQDMMALESGKKTLAKEIRGLNDLNSFLDNNLKAVAETKQMFTECQNGETPEQGTDLDNRLIQFGDFATNLNQKDKAIDRAFKALDESIDRDAIRESGEADIENQKLVNVRERMLGMLFFHANVLGNADRLNVCWSSDILNLLAFNNCLNFYCSKMTGMVVGGIIPVGSKVDGIQSKMNEAQLNMFFSRDALNSAINASREKLGMYSKDDLGAIHSQEQLGPFMGSKEQLSLIYGSKDELGILYTSKDQLGGVIWGPLGSVMDLDKLGLQMAHGRVEMKTLGMYSKEKLGGMFGKDQLGLWGKTNLDSVAAFSKQLGVHGW